MNKLLTKWGQRKQGRSGTIDDCGKPDGVY